MTIAALPPLSSYNSSSSSFDAVGRRNELFFKMKNLIGKISIPLEVKKMAIDSFYSSAYLKEDFSISYNNQYPFIHPNLINIEIGIPSSYLFKTEDLPSNFLIQDFNDPHLYDEQFLKSFAEGINSLIESANRNQNPDNHFPLIKPPKDHSDFRYLRLFLMLLRDPMLFDKCKEFLIGHELCHALENNQSAFLWLEEGNRITYVAGTGVLGGLAFCGLGLVFSRTLRGLSLAGIGAMLSAATIALTRFGLSKCHEIEKNCDLGAIDALNDASGSIYYFETIRQLCLAEKARNASLPCDDQGNFLNDPSHPYLTSRIAYCRQWQNKEA